MAAMRRANTFNLNPGKEEEAILHEWADNCSRMYNEINYKRRQSCSKKLRKLHRKRKRRFRDSINKIVADFVRKCWELGVAEMVCGGDLRGIRKDAKFNPKANACIISGLLAIYISG